MIDKERWHKYTFYQQMGNIASELSRAILLKKKNNIAQMDNSLLRLIELLNLTIQDKKNIKRLKELCRFKEVVADWFCRTNTYSINFESLKTYSLHFAMLSRK